MNVYAARSYSSGYYCKAGKSNKILGWYSNIPVSARIRARCTGGLTEFPGSRTIFDAISAEKCLQRCCAIHRLSGIVYSIKPDSCIDYRYIPGH